MFKVISRFAFALLAAGLVTACGEKDDPKPDESKAPTASLSVSPASIQAGESVTLTWTTEGATSVTIVDDQGGSVDTTGKLSGSAELQPEATTTWTLVAKNDAGQVSKTAKVSVGGDDAPVILFDAQPARIDFGDSATLSWTVTGADRVVLRTGDEEETTTASGTRDVSPVDTTTYVIEAEGPGGDASESRTVEVAPKVVSFGTDATGKVAKGQMVQLSWETAGAEAIALSNLDGWNFDVDGELSSGNVPAPVGESGKFRLTATRAGVTATAEVELAVAGTPAIRSFTADPTVFDVRNPGNITLAWELDGAVTALELRMSGIPTPVSLPTLAEGFTLQTIFETTTFTLVATNDAGSVQEEVVVVGMLPAKISSFGPSQALVGAGDEFTLSWETANADIVILEVDGAVIAEDLEATGSMVRTLAASATFVLRADNALEDEASATAAVIVGPPIVDSFSVSATQGAPGDAVSFTWTTTAATAVRVLDDAGEEICVAADAGQLAAGGCEGVVPEGATGFRLEATNGSGPTLGDLEPFLATSSAMIETFTVTPAVASVDAPVTFRWVVTEDAAGVAPTLTLEDDAGNVYNVSAADPLDGSIDLQFDTAGIYVFTLTATTPGNDPVEATRTLEVVDLPEVISFTATPSTYAPGDPNGVVLSWQSTGGASVTIHTVVGGTISGAPIFSNSTPAVAASGTFTVFPAAQTTYRVTVKNAAGAADTDDALVELSGPGIIDFSTQTPVVTAGSTVTLDWSTVGGTVYIKGMVEVPAANAPYEDISTTGIPIIADSCIGQYPVVDEGCAELTITGGYVFPYDGAGRTNVRMFNNGFLSFDQTPGPDETWEVTGLPSTLDSFVHLAPYWLDLVLDPFFGEGMFGEIRDQAADPHVILQWKNAVSAEAEYFWEIASSLSFEVVAFQSGAFEFRYGTMFVQILQSLADGETASIGFQNTTGTVGYALNPGKTAVPGGLSNRSFRAERNAAPVGSLEVVVRETTTFELCVDDGSGTPLCEPLTVTVN